MRRVVRDRVALIGDAAGPMDAITGEGLSVGFRQAVALADALATDRLQQYQAAHRRLRRSPNLMSALMLSISRRTGLRRRVIHALADRPSLLNFALAAHSGVAPITAAPLAPVAGFISNVIIGRSSRHTPQSHDDNSRIVSTQTMGKVIDLSRKSFQQ
jgi:flavin-dependent dehydrogenase